MLLKCERCGAPLEVPAGASVRCNYCGTTATAPAPPPAPAVHGYGHGHGYQGHYPARPQVPAAPAKSNHWGSILIVLTTTLAVLGSIAGAIVPRLVSSTTTPAIQKALGNVGGVTSPTRSAFTWSASD